VLPFAQAADDQHVAWSCTPCLYLNLQIPLAFSNLRLFPCHSASAIAIIISPLSHIFRQPHPAATSRATGAVRFDRMPKLRCCAFCLGKPAGIWAVTTWRRLGIPGQILARWRNFAARKDFETSQRNSRNSCDWAYLVGLCGGAPGSPAQLIPSFLFIGRFSLRRADGQRISSGA
jgi:hypothetical protein